MLAVLAAVFAGLVGFAVSHEGDQPKTVTRTVTVQGPEHVVHEPGKTVVRQSPPPAPGKYTVQPGDTIWSIAAEQYVPAIEKANAAMLKRQDGVIYAGEVLVIPMLPA